jgi:Spy/CpxP family protein refolding chaperone
MKKVVLVGLIVALGIGLGGLALAQFSGYGGCRGGMMGPGYGGHMMGPGYGPGYGGYGPQASQLSPEQIKQLEQLRLKHWEETKGLRNELFSKHQELEGLSLQANPDPKVIEKLQKEIFSLRQKLQEKTFVFRQEMNRIAPQLRNCDNRGQGWDGRGPRHGQNCWND